jgi:sugar transferase (PEP-CTERM/EpsH1 system associated)
MKKEPLLFLCHRIPFPPDKGDKIATFNLLKFLSKRYDVHLGCFVDDSFDLQFIDELDVYCESSFCFDICDRSQAISGIKSLIKGKAISVIHYDCVEFQSWVDSTISRFHINKLFVYSSGMSQFIDSDKYKHNNRVVDLCDVDSDKWRQYAEKKPWYSRWIYAREQKKLAIYEQEILKRVDKVTLVTEDEALLFKNMSPRHLKHKITMLSNGVDISYFDPQADFDLTDLPSIEELCISFTGAMDYWANEDAVTWFCQNVWPKIVSVHPSCVFYIVGGKPSDTVKKLSSLTGVIVTGRVPDVRPYLAASTLAVAPMRIARGVQNKVLEAMAMAKPVVMTSMGQEGIDIDDYQASLVIDDPEMMAEKINQLISDKQNQALQNREWIINKYSWEGALKQLPQLLNEHSID